jgi:hypothetical protein
VFRILAEDDIFLDWAEHLAHAPYEEQVARARCAQAGLPPIMGAEAVPSHPLGPPTTTGNTLTVDMALNQPTRITRMIMDLTLQRFIVDRVFTSAGGVSGGAVIYDQATTNELYLTRDVERVAPGGEFPLVESERPVPKVAEVEKWGGKVFVTQEARDRNNVAGFTNKVRQLANTIVRKLNQRGIAELDTSISASGQTFVGNDWTTVVTGGSSQSNNTLWPAADFAKAWRLAEEDELGVNYTLWLLNPQEYATLITIYGADGIRSLLSELNLTIYVSNRVPAGTAYVVAEGQVGEMRLEQALATETWYEEKTQRHWVQSSVRPVMYVTNPFSVLSVTGLAG